MIQDCEIILNALLVCVHIEFFIDARSSPCYTEITPGKGAGMATARPAPYRALVFLATTRPNPTFPSPPGKGCEQAPAQPHHPRCSEVCAKRTV